MVSTTVYGGYFTLMCVYSCGCVCFVSVHILLCECMFVCLCNCLCEWYWDIHTCWYIIKKTGHSSDGSAPMSEWQRLPWRCLQTLLPPFSLSSPQAEGLVGGEDNRFTIEPTLLCLEANALSTELEERGGEKEGEKTHTTKTSRRVCCGEEKKGLYWGGKHVLGEEIN